MKILFEDVTILFEDGKVRPNMYLLVTDKNITYIGERKPEDGFDRIFNCRGKVLCPGFYNCHTHVPMTLFRGYAENLPLSRWLHEKIFPAEDKLYPEAVQAASMLAIAEMIQNGIVSFSDMYFFCEEIVRSVAETGIKANISRSTVAFDPEICAENDERFQESVRLFERYHNSADERIKIDMSIHAEYSTVAASCRYLSDFALEHDTGIQIHLSETFSEHQSCIEKYSLTPTEFFEEHGVFRVPVTAAHCVHVTDSDVEILKRYKATVVHNPVSNLKLGSGVMRLTKMLNAGINVTLGTDGAASNNTLNIQKEAYIAALLQKGITGEPEKLTSGEFVRMLTENGAKAQGRVNCGKIAEGYRADLILLNFDRISIMPVYHVCDSFLYSADVGSVEMTMVDGNILYENGEFKTLDIEKVKFQFQKVVRTYFD